MRRFAFVLVLLAGCHKHDHPAASEPEEKTLQVTVWHERYEIFLEHTFIVAKEPVTFITHVTDLATLEPRREGPALFVLQLGQETPIELVDPAPARAGIYTPKVTFPKAGSWKVTLRIDQDGIELPPFTVHATKADAEKAPAPEAPDGVSFLKEQQWKIRTKVEPVARRTMVTRIAVPANVTAKPGRRAAVIPPVAGRLLESPGRSLPVLGERVERGDVLALIQPPFSDFAAKVVEADAEVIRTRLAHDQAKKIFDRIQDLFEKKAKSEREVQEADFAMRSAKANHDAAVALQETYRKSGAIFVKGIDLPVIELRAPISGTIVQVFGAVGEHVDQSLFTILDAAIVHVEARISESDLPRVREAVGAVYELPGSRGAFAKLDGRALFLSPDVDPVTRTAALVFEAGNPDGALRPGMTLSLHVETTAAREALAIPVSAVVDEEGRPIAFVQRSGETFEKRDLELGTRDGPFVEVVSGLRAGDRVVTKGAYAVRLASVSTAIPAHGHAH